jgi:dipeptidyl aminopeptidase/acylaminoacyl peptidase
MKRCRFKIRWLPQAILVLSFSLSSVFSGDMTLTPHWVAKLRSVTSAEISPDGQLVAYTLSVPRKIAGEKDGAAWVELHLLDLNSGESRPFVFGEVNIGSIAWVPAKRLISFLAKRGDDAHKSLYTIAPDGGEARKALCLSSDIRSYSWSPDGNRVALIADEPEREEIKELKKTGFNQEIYEEDWRQRKVYLASISDPDSSPAALELKGTAFAVQWSPVDDRLAVSLAPTPLVDDSYMYQRV